MTDVLQTPIPNEAITSADFLALERRVAQLELVFGRPIPHTYVDLAIEPPTVGPTKKEMRFRGDQRRR
jgi:hypothetical protein